MSSEYQASQARERTMSRLIVCGSVDDGKSTLVGRLLLDLDAVHDDQLAHIADASKRRGDSTIDLSLLTDGLRAERQQGITIDVAYRFFSTAHRDFALIDAPGHEQYTCNMVTGASQADVAVILLDAARGITAQTKRHAYLVNLLEIPSVVFAVNKMDLAHYDRSVFDRMVNEVNDWFDGAFATKAVSFVPVSALAGDNVVRRAASMAWYEGPTLLEYLERLEPRATIQAHSRLFVQSVLRSRDLAEGGYRGYAGRMAAGSFTTGDSVVVLPRGRTATIRRLERYGERVERVRAGQSVTLFFEEDIDVGRGDLVCGDADPAALGERMSATLVWMSSQPLVYDAWYALRLGSRWLKAKVTDCRSTSGDRLLEGRGDGAVEFNDIVTAELVCSEPLAYDVYSKDRTTGSFILVDESTHETAAAGMVCPPRMEATRQSSSSLVLSVATASATVTEARIEQVLMRAMRDRQLNLLDESAALVEMISASDVRVDTMTRQDVRNWRQRRALISAVSGWYGRGEKEPSARDIAKTLNCTVVLVVTLEPGCFNHALLTLNAMAHDDVRVEGWIAVTGRACPPEVNMEFSSLRRELRPPLLGVYEAVNDR